MGILVEYFAAPSDDAAAALVENGPTVKSAVSPALKKAYKANDPVAGDLMWKIDVGLAEEGVYALSCNGVYPDKQLIDLEGLLTGASRESVGANPRAAAMPGRPGNPPLASADPDDGPWVVTVTDELRDALCSADARQRANVAYQWAESGAFGNDGDGEDLARFIDRFAELARIAKRRDERLYCWMSL